MWMHSDCWAYKPEVVYGLLLGRPVDLMGSHRSHIQTLLYTV